MGQKLRIDIVGMNEFSQKVDVDVSQAVSSIRVDVVNRSITVFYKRKEDGKPLMLSDEPETVVNKNRKGELIDSTNGVGDGDEDSTPVNEVATQNEPAPTPLTGVVQPVDNPEEVADDMAKMDAHVGGDPVGDGGVDGPTVTVSGGTATVDGKKPTTGGKRPTGSTKS